MAEPSVIQAGEVATDDLLSLIETEGRVVVETEVLGSPEEVTLRFDGETYFCDTPTTLHTHDERAEMATCLRNHGYVADAED